MNRSATPLVSGWRTRSMRARSNSTSLESSPLRRWASASSRSAGSSERSRSPVLSPARDSRDEPRSPALPTSPAASIIVFPLPSTLSSSSFSGQYGVQRNRGQLSGCAQQHDDGRDRRDPKTGREGGHE